MHLTNVNYLFWYSLHADVVAIFSIFEHFLLLPQSVGCVFLLCICDVCLCVCVTVCGGTGRTMQAPDYYLFAAEYKGKVLESWWRRRCAPAPIYAHINLMGFLEFNWNSFGIFSLLSWSVSCVCRMLCVCLESSVVCLNITVLCWMIDWYAGKWSIQRHVRHTKLVITVNYIWWMQTRYTWMALPNFIWL